MTGRMQDAGCQMSGGIQGFKVQVGGIAKRQAYDFIKCLCDLPLLIYKNYAVFFPLVNDLVV